MQNGDTDPRPGVHLQRKDMITKESKTKAVQVQNGDTDLRPGVHSCHTVEAPLVDTLQGLSVLLRGAAGPSARPWRLQKARVEDTANGTMCAAPNLPRYLEPVSAGVPAEGWPVSRTLPLVQCAQFHCLATKTGSRALCPPGFTAAP